MNPRPQCQPNIIPQVQVELLRREQRLLVNSGGLARLLAVEVAQVWTLHHAGRVPLPIHLGNSVRWRVQEIRRWAEAGCPPRVEWMRMQEQLVEFRHY